ncbi:RNA polymerase sigma-70 factor [Chitinophaga sp. MM2321]|uniref:RNA polymerase sigma factor n=1 Tax=Chitinophaga sp. MM2321 TaxID=3137178 RepID=UPI0032D568F1
MLPTSLYTESELVQKVAGGDEAAYKELFTRYWDQIYSTAFMFTKSPEMSEDMAQEVFARIWVKREKLKDVIRFDAFLFITARNLIFDQLRQKVFTYEYGQYLTEYFKDPSLSPVDNIELKEMEKIIREGISSLPRQQQTAFCLSRFQGLKHEEIAVKMGISRESVKSHIVRAIASLRKHLGQHAAPVLVFIMLQL